ncbi:MAG: amino acid transporter [Endozoicomonadaceae bacterium]|nr:amino acid transporter [Endozoicomonadaceae bacterium]
MSVSIKKQIGSTLIVIGTEIGAGILALPILTAQLGLFMSMIVMVLSYFLMVYTSLIIADINLRMPDGASFSRMARQYLGAPGEIISWIIFMLLMYSLGVAYISAASSSFKHILPDINQNIIACFFVTFFGFFVMKGIGMVDQLNRILSFILIITLAWISFIFMPYIDINHYFDSNLSLKIFALSCPVILTSFTSHLTIPSMRLYLNSDPKVIRRVLIIGSTVPLILYIGIILAILGSIPLYGPVSFMDSIFSKKDILMVNIADILTLLEDRMNTKLVTVTVNTFSSLAIMTSYLGVSMSLYHYLIDGLKLNRIKKNSLRLLLGALLTFAIPLFIVIFYPNLFLRALAFVGSCVVILLIILPTLMTYQLDKQKTDYYYSISKIKSLRILAILAAICIIIAEQSMAWL